MAVFVGVFGGGVAGYAGAGFGHFGFGWLVIWSITFCVGGYWASVRFVDVGEFGIYGEVW